MQRLLICTDNDVEERGEAMTMAVGGRARGGGRPVIIIVVVVVVVVEPCGQ